MTLLLLQFSCKTAALPFKRTIVPSPFPSWLYVFGLILTSWFTFGVKGGKAPPALRSDGSAHERHAPLSFQALLELQFQRIFFYVSAYSVLCFEHIDESVCLKVSVMSTGQTVQIRDHVTRSAGSLHDISLDETLLTGSSKMHHRLSDQRRNAG